jgi:transcriptional regulator with XRE-family HTH domain
MTTGLKFRNVDASPEDPVETWPFEGILTAVERGTLPDWHRLAEAIQADPWGPVAQQVLEAVRLTRPYGTTELLEGVVERARKVAVDAERQEVAAEIRRLVTESGLSVQEFAARVGTSRPRLSTYMSGKVVPSATLMVRIRRVGLPRSLWEAIEARRYGEGKSCCYLSAGPASGLGQSWPRRTQVVVTRARAVVVGPPFVEAALAVAAPVHGVPVQGVLADDVVDRGAQVTELLLEALAQAGHLSLLLCVAAGTHDRAGDPHDLRGVGGEPGQAGPGIAADAVRAGRFAGHQLLRSRR